MIIELETQTIPALVVEPYFRPSHLGPACSTGRTSRLRERRVQMSYEKRVEPADITQLAQDARQVFLQSEAIDPALARARALEYVIEHCAVNIDPDALFLGGEDPFFFNLLLPALQADRYATQSGQIMDEPTRRMQKARIFMGPCFEGHITPGLEYILSQGTSGFRRRAEESMWRLRRAKIADPEGEYYYEAALLSCDSLDRFAERYRLAAESLLENEPHPDRAEELRQVIDVLNVVPHQPAQTLRQALQSYWLAYILVTLEMGGCTPGGGLGLGRIDQFLYPYYLRDLRAGRLNRVEALELLEQFLLCFCHVDYYTGHQLYTPGSQASLGGITPSGQDAFNELSELILEASLRINMPAPYISLRLYRNAPERFWEVAVNYIASGLGFPVVNDEVLIPAMLRHGRSLGDARDYICSCCYEHTIPGREAFHPSCIFINLPQILELALNQGRSILVDENLGCATPPVESFRTFEDLLSAFYEQIHYVLEKIVLATNRADQMHATYRRYPLMSLFIDDCLAQARDVCAGGARYNLTGCVAAGLPNTVNSLAAIRQIVFKNPKNTAPVTMHEMVEALRVNFLGYEHLHRRLLAAPKWGNDLPAVDELAGEMVDRLYAELAPYKNARNGRWQLALYSFVSNHWFGEELAATPDGRQAHQILTRNLNPSWGNDLQGPTAVLKSLSQIDFTTAPDGSSLDLRFDPAVFRTAEQRQVFAGFLKAFVELGIMEMQISVVDTATLLEARAHPELYPHLLVRVAGYSARFVDLSSQEQDEIIGRSMQRY